MLRTWGLLYGLGYGVGYPDQLDPASPAAGANFALTVDGAWVLRPLAVKYQIDTDANAANRFVSVDYIDARGITRHRNAAGLVVTASTTAQVFDHSVSRGVAEWAANTPVLAPLEPFFLYPGYTLQITVDNKQAGDTITAIHMLVEKFETGTQGYELGAVRTEE